MKFLITIISFCTLSSSSTNSILLLIALITGWNETKLEKLSTEFINDNKDKSITSDNKEDVNALIKKNESDIPVFQSIETTEK